MDDITILNRTAVAGMIYGAMGFALLTSMSSSCPPWLKTDWAGYIYVAAFIVALTLSPPN